MTDSLEEIHPRADVATLGPGVATNTPHDNLWAVHVEGPDDIIAATDRAEAERKSAEINAAYEAFAKRPDASEFDARWHANAVPWPFSAADHAEEIARGDERWEG